MQNGDKQIHPVPSIPRNTLHILRATVIIQSDLITISPERKLPRYSSDYWKMA